MKNTSSLLLLGVLVLFSAGSLFWHQKSEPADVISEPQIAPTINTDSLSPGMAQDLHPGQLFMIGHWADTPMASTTNLIREHRIGGVIIMSAPSDTSVIRDWVETWQGAVDYPLLIAIDQEGGPVTRLRGENFIETGQRDISTSKEAYEVGFKRGQELAALGINMNFAPVLDTATSPDSFMYERVFPEIADATLLAAEMTKGMADAGVVAVAKHFPGHDDTSDDSHFTLPTVSLQLEELNEFTRPFADYVQTANPAALMTAHVLFPEITDLPATLSPFFLTDYLQTELGFTGIIITDDMSMDAIDTNWTTKEGALQALDAGASLVLFAAEPTLAVEAITHVEQNLNEATLADRKQRLNQFVESLPQLD